MATIRDVARNAGVSIATVSAVINNTVPVSPPPASASCRRSRNAA